MCWAFFDKIYCISVDSREDRRAEAKIQFEKVGLADRVEFVIVRKHPINSEQGIYESHIRCLQNGIAADAKTILIFEDDIVFDRFNEQNLRECIEFLATDADWNALFFGCIIKGSQKTTCRTVLKIRYRCSAHAYAMNRQFAETIANRQWSGMAFDDMLASFEDGMYLLYPSIAFQSDSPSDNDNLKKIDRIRRLLGGIKLIQKGNEFWHYHKSAIILLHLLILLIIIGRMMI